MTNNVANSITYIEVCAGVAGLGIGFELALEHFFGRPAKCLAYCERQGYAATTLGSRMEESSLESSPIWAGDMANLPWRLYRGRVVILIGGIPCQPHSVAGDQLHTEDERWLWPTFWDLADKLQVEWIALENVSGFISGGLGPVITDLAKSGWSAEWLHLRASEVGASHQRTRIFLLAHRPGGGLGKLRKPPGSGGQPYWIGFDMGHPEGDIQLGPAVFSRDDGQWIPAGRPGSRVDDPAGARRQGSAGSRPTADEQGGQCVPSPGIERMADPSSERDGSVAERQGGNRPGTPDVDRGGSGVADTGDRQLSEPGRGQEGRAGAGSAIPIVPAMGDTEGAIGRSELEEGRPPGHRRAGPAGASNDVADAGSGKRRRHRQPRQREERPSAPGGGSELANTERKPGGAEQLKEPGQEPRRGAGAPDGPMSRDTNAELAHADGQRLRVEGDSHEPGGKQPDQSVEPLALTIEPGRSGRGSEPGNSGQELATIERDRASLATGPDRGGGRPPTLPVFAPGPADPRWPELLEYFPMLAPAIPRMAMPANWSAGNEAQAQPLIRQLADGTFTPLVDSGRTDALRASGNSCSPLQAGAAFIELLSRFKDMNSDDLDAPP